METSGQGEGGPLDGMIERLFQDAEMPPKEVKGVSQGFLDGEWNLWGWVVKGVKGMGLGRGRS